MFGWLNSWVVVCLVGWLVDWLVGWLVGWFVCLFVGFLIVWYYSFSVSWLRCLLVTWFRFYKGCSLIRSSRQLSLLEEFPGGNQVDGLPPAHRLQQISTSKT